MEISASLRLLFALGLLAAPLALTACSSDEVDEQTLDQPPPQNVDGAPPIAPYEAKPFIENQQAELWRPGYWGMRDGQFIWVPGKIIARPSPTAVWNGARWVKHNYGWTFENGHWE